MVKFFQTGMGRKFYEGDVPRIAKALENIAAELKRQNDLQEEKNNLPHDKWECSNCGLINSKKEKQCLNCGS